MKGNECNDSQSEAVCEVCDERTAVTKRGPMPLHICEECADGWDDLQYIDDGLGETVLEHETVA